jgi:hypothetical protein
MKFPIQSLSFFFLLLALVLLTNAGAIGIKVCPSFDLHFIDQWTHLLPEEYPSLSGVKTAYFAEKISVYTFLADIAVKNDSMGKVKQSIRIVDPKGKTVIKQRNIKAFDGPVATGNQTLLSNAGITFRLSNESVPGTYLVITTVKDVVRKEKVRDTAYLKVVDTIPQYDFPDDSTFFFWLENYYRDPDPKSAVPAFDYYLKNDVLKNDSLFAAVFYFFSMLVVENPFVGEKIIQKAKTQNAEYQNYVAMLLTLIKWSKADLVASLPLVVKKVLDGSMENIDPFTRFIYKLDPNPILYTFYYSGSYKAIKGLAQAMWSRDLDAFPDSMRCEKCETEESRDAVKEKKYYWMAKRILENLFKFHTLARGYMKFILKKEELNPIVKEELEEIVSGRVP